MNPKKEIIDGLEDDDFYKDFEIVVIKSSIKNNQKNNIEVYPNPANDYISIKGIENATIILNNMIGKQVIKLHNCNENSKIEIDNISKGIYLISIEENGYVTMMKLVVGG
ncbi:MAG: T9SS type A sorting domain-containing protein [Marinilabiliaceae bacterium]|nr:T9SS type A sorting domain-containing protein [Marinilabiliaceae bacterium]